MRIQFGNIQHPAIQFGQNNQEQVEFGHNAKEKQKVIVKQGEAKNKKKKQTFAANNWIA